MEERVPVTFRVPPGWGPLRLDAFLGRRLRAASRSAAQRLIREGKVLLAGRAAKPSASVAAGDAVVVLFDPRPAEAVPDVELAVLHEDEQLLAVDKPSGLLTHPSLKRRLGSVTDLLERRGLRAHPVHRLDAETSGVLLLAKTRAAARGLGEAFEARRVRKEYLALARGRAAFEWTLADAPLAGTRGVRGRQSVKVGGVRALTELSRLAASEAASLLMAVPHTGRLHQIRAHLAWLGLPILGDKLYGGGLAEAPRLMLHARRLVLAHPATGRELVVEAPVPADLRERAGALASAL